MTVREVPHPKNKLVILRGIPVFNSCSEKELLLIADRTRLVEYKRGESVYCKGDAAEAFYIVVSGRLRVSLREIEKEKTVSELHNGDAFGEISLLTGEVHSVTVGALSDTLVLELKKNDFEEVINRIPSLVLYLSRLLSKRLRTRELADGHIEATIAAVLGATTELGKTLFTVVLAGTLKRETHRDVIVVDMNPETAEQRKLYGKLSPSSKKLGSILGLSAKIPLDEALGEHTLGFTVLSIGKSLTEKIGDEAIATLLNGLAKRYAYVLIDLPNEVNTQALKAITQSDVIYLMADQYRENFGKTQKLYKRLKEILTPGDERVKLIVNLMSGIGVRISFDDMRENLGIAVSSTLPRVSHARERVTLQGIAVLLEDNESVYTRAVRRSARELSRSLVGLALGSGAALGLAHIGVLKVLEREKIPIDLIAGTSIGSMIAGLWASGKSAEEIERLALRFKNSWDIRKLFLFDVEIPNSSIIVGILVGLFVWSLAGFLSGLFFGFLACMALGVVLGPIAGGPIQGKQLLAKLQRDFGGKRFEDTWLPLRVVASNPMTREEIVFESGPIADAVRASVSIPGIFKPVVRGEQVYLDGGVVNPVPVSVLKDAGAHRVIAVNVFPSYAEFRAHVREVERRRKEKDEKLSMRSFPIRLFAWLRQEFWRSMSPLIFDVIVRSMQAMEHQIAEIACHDADLTLKPTLPGSHWLEFFTPEKFIQRGEEVAMELLPELRRLSGLEEASVDKPHAGTVP